MDITRAKEIADVAGVIVESAKVEIQFLEAIDSTETTEFFEARRLTVQAEREQGLATIVNPMGRRLG
jgi:hypothetical protein